MSFYRAPFACVGLPLVATILLLSGCTSFDMQKNAAALQPPLPLPPEKALSYTRQPIHIRSYEHLATRSKCDIFRLKFAPHVNVLHQRFDVTITYYRNKGAGPRPLILCLPIMDGKNKVAKIFANYLASKGYHAAIVHKQKDMYKQLTADNYKTLLNLGLEQIVYNHMQAIDWLEDQPEIDRDRIGVAGVSMGSIKALLLSAYDPRIKATFAALTGGDLPYILSRSDDGGVTRTRQAILANTGLSLAELREDLRQRITHDPMLLAPYMDTREVMLILASLDTTVPFEKGQELRKALRGPETVYLLGTHLSSVIFLNYILEKCDHFMRRKLDVPTRASKKPFKFSRHITPYK